MHSVPCRIDCFGKECSCSVIATMAPTLYSVYCSWSCSALCWWSELSPWCGYGGLHQAAAGRSRRGRCLERQSTLLLRNCESATREATSPGTSTHSERAIWVTRSRKGPAQPVHHLKAKRLPLRNGAIDAKSGPIWLNTRVAHRVFHVFQTKLGGCENDHLPVSCPPRFAVR